MTTPTSSRVAQLAFSEAIRRLLSVMEGELSRGQIMAALKLKDRVSFVDYYLSPALKIGLVEMTQPDSPRSPTQKYRLTGKGIAVKGTLSTYAEATEDKK